MKYALIAAGQGSRLVSDGIQVPKPLVKVGGEPLLGRLLHIFLNNNADSVCIIINEEMTEVRDFLEQQHLFHSKSFVRTGMALTAISIPWLRILPVLPDGFLTLCFRMW